MLVLRDDSLLVRLDPAHGAEVLDLIDLRTGRQLLGRPPFGSAEPRDGDLDEATWTASYRGGWQLVCPNAGNACAVNGAHHGFHGRASNDRWRLLDANGAAARVAWEGHGLILERRYALAGGALRVETEARPSTGRVPLMAVEHVALGLELLEPEVELGLPAGLAYELSETDGPAEPPSGATRWPEVRLLGGSVERADRWPLRRARSRLFAVADVPEGRALIRNAARGHGLELAWDAEWLRHVWVWHEVRTSGGVWRGQAELLVVEPASVPHTLGLAAAIAHGQARWLEPGERVSYRISARPVL